MLEAFGVGFIDKLFRKRDSVIQYSETSGFQDSYSSASIFGGSSSLAPIIAKDLGYYGEGMPATILEALRVPAVFRGISLLSTAAAQVRPGSGSPAWLSEGVGSISPEARLISIIQDLIFHRDSCLMVERETSSDVVTAAIRLPRELWDLDASGRVMLAGELHDQSHFIYISSLMPMGLLEAAAEAIEHYHDLNRTIRSRAKNPIPLIDLHLTNEFEGTTAELKDVQDNWHAARNSANGAVAVSPVGVEVKTPNAGGIDDASMLTNARNASRLDVANFLNIPAALLEGANGSSDTYTNALQNKDELVSLSLAGWLEPIAARLSLPDVVGEAGSRVEFDLSKLTVAETGDAKGNTNAPVGAPPAIEAGESVGDEL